MRKALIGRYTYDERADLCYLKSGRGYQRNRWKLEGRLGTWKLMLFCSISCMSSRLGKAPPKKCFFGRYLPNVDGWGGWFPNKVQTPQNPPNCPEKFLFLPKFHLSFSQISQKPWGGWVVKQIWERFPKFFFFLQLPLGHLFPGHKFPVGHCFPGN